MPLKISFWGCTGSIPSPINTEQLRKKLTDTLWATKDTKFSNKQSVCEFINKLPFHQRGTYKGNTNCVQIHSAEDIPIFCDAGSGLRTYADSLPEFPEPRTYHIFLTHLHWDHIQGLSFFKPAFQAGNKIIIHTLHHEAEDAVRRLFSVPYFPIDYDQLDADFEFDIRKDGASFEVGSLEIKTLKQDHPNHSWAFRFETGGKAVVISTDCQHANNAAKDLNYPFLKFFNKSDLLVFDGQYAYNQSAKKNNIWGHSDIATAVELAARAKVKQLIITHHEPANNDATIHQSLAFAEKQAQELATELNYQTTYPNNIILAYDGLKIEA
ncbi:MAG: Ribonuclease BN [Opitutia bacterium UBA7350]|nr:MAG: Ribonuclease BN [Opitutae bacterium UBA7350]